MTRQERSQAGYEVSDDSKSEEEEEEEIDEDAEVMVDGPVTCRQYGQRQASDGKFFAPCKCKQGIYIKDVCILFLSS